MDSDVLKRLGETSHSGDIGAAAMILCEARDGKDFYSIAFAALAAMSTYSHRAGWQAAMNKILQENFGGTKGN